MLNEISVMVINYQQRWIKTFHILLSLPLSLSALGGSSALHIPAFPSGGCLIDYVPQVCQLLTNKVKFLHLITEIAESIRLHHQWSVCLCIVHNNVLLSSWARSKQLSVFAWIACMCTSLVSFDKAIWQVEIRMWLSLAWGVTDIALPWHLSFSSAPLLISTQTAWIINPSNLTLHAPPVATRSSGHTHLNLGHALL